MYLSKFQNVFVKITKCISKLQNLFVQIVKYIHLNCKMYLSKLQNVFLQGEVEGLVFSRPRRVNWGLPCQKPSCLTSEAKLHSVSKAHRRPDKTISKAEGLYRISFTILFTQTSLKTMSPGKTSNNQNRTFFSG